MHVPYQSIITIEPGKRGGRPCIRGMRISVYDVLSYLAAGMTPQQILDEFPYLTADDIQAALLMPPNVSDKWSWPTCEA